MTETKSIFIECDVCKKDLSPRETGYPHAYILELRSRDVAIKNWWSGFHAVDASAN